MPKYSNLEQPIRVLRTPDTDGDFPQRVAYDRSGEELRMKLREDIRIMYKCIIQERAEQVKERIRKEEIYKRQASNIDANTSMSILEKVSKKWVRVRQKSTRTHFICVSAFVKGYTRTEILM